jgi:Skp family chaperone for outer membrane proteins
MKHILTVGLMCLATAASAQRMKKERLTVGYVQPPSINLEEGMGYSSTVILDYKAEVEAELAAAEEEYQAAQRNILKKKQLQKRHTMSSLQIMSVHLKIGTAKVA